MFYLEALSFPNAEYELNFQTGSNIDGIDGSWEKAVFIPVGHVLWFQDCVWYGKSAIDYSGRYNKVV